MPRSLIEQWFPAAAIGAESLRERGSTKAYPPINFVHVWWARRPLTISRAAILASMLPAWPADDDVNHSAAAAKVRAALEAEFPTGESGYHAWFLRSLGIAGDPAAARALIKGANDRGERLGASAYGYDRAFTWNPDDATIERLRRLAALRGDVAVEPRLVDPFAGGGSIPLEAVRYGCQTVANELNPVAVAILKGTIEVPVRLSASFRDTIRGWGQIWSERVRGELAAFFPHGPKDASIAGYIWAHAVPCPSTGRLTPLAPNFWLSTGKQRAAVHLEPDTDSGTLRVTVVEGDSAARYGDRATYKNGAGVSIWDPAATMSSDDISQLAKGGEMSALLLAVCVTEPARRERRFRAPSEADIVAIASATTELEKRLPAWEVDGLVPDEKRFIGPADRSARYGIVSMRDLFAPRQLLANVVALENLLDTLGEARTHLQSEEWEALTLYLGFALDRAIDYNSRLASWDATRWKVRNTFDRHDFSFKWSFAEFDAAHALIPWVVDHSATNFVKVRALLNDSGSLTRSIPTPLPDVRLGSATRLNLPTASVDLVVTDPPYYDNVMYAECADYFYVWMKRWLKPALPHLVADALTNKELEAVANVALFKDVVGKRDKRRDVTAAKLADSHYEELLKQAFLEANRILKQDGVMTVMFTHKRVDAWDTLGAALLEAGFEISSSWPVHTESEHSLHQAKKNSASSTIVLSCRKRTSTDATYWADVRREVEDAAEEAAKRFSAEGIKGVDLTLATYGPALSVLSRNWPVYTGNLTEDGEREKLRPDAALDLARHRVALLKKREVLGGRDVEFDRATDWWLLAWNDFQAAQFPAGEALKLCIAMDLDLDDVAKQHKLVKAASGDVTLLTPAQRRTAKSLDPDAATWPILIDALHALMLTHDEEGLSASRAWLTRTGKDDDERFSALVEAAVHAVPRSRDKDGEFTRPEARILESLRATLFDSIKAPTELESGEALTLDFAQG